MNNAGRLDDYIFAEIDAQLVNDAHEPSKGRPVKFSDLDPNKAYDFRFAYGKDGGYMLEGQNIVNQRNRILEALDDFRKLRTTENKVLYISPRSVNYQDLPSRTHHLHNMAVAGDYS